MNEFRGVKPQVISVLCTQSAVKCSVINFLALEWQLLLSTVSQLSGWLDDIIDSTTIAMDTIEEGSMELDKAVKFLKSYGYLTETEEVTVKDFF